ncbi:OmpA family protein [Caviibacter abscessus]|uniref:OmpA family protein n=1 Tax=Caviibacter abscessus TaxID=1766719 RepID=UPI00082E19EC|nr:OmpA family protein [Caviibacter abscessus]
MIKNLKGVLYRNRISFDRKTLIMFLITGMVCFAQPTTGKTKDGEGNVQFGDGSSITTSTVGVTLVGAKSKATQNYIGIFGYNSEVKSVLGNAMGYGVSIGEQSVSAYALGTQASIGNNAKNSYALGQKATVGTGSESAYAIGDGASIGNMALFSYAIGTDTKVNVSNSYAIGNFTTVSGEQTIALGNEITATKENSVYLGHSSSYTDTGSISKGLEQTYSSQSVDGLELKNFAGTTNGIVTIGSQGSERRLQNVSAGLIDEQSTDAVNGSQLYSATVALNSKIKELDEIVVKYTDKNKTKVKLGKDNGDKVTLSGIKNATQDDEAVNLKQFNDKINELTEKGLIFAGNTGTHKVKLGETVTIKGGHTTSDVDAKNVKTEISDGILTIKFANSPEFTKVTAGTGTNKVVIGETGVQFGDLVYINGSGLNANSKKITNVADGTVDTNSKDAINGSQLDKVKTELSTKIDKNEKAIKELKNDIEGNNSQMEENTRAIADNKSKMESNTQKIKKNKESIDKNKQKIEENENGISSNKTRIGVNEQNIQTNKGDIVTNREEIGKNRTSISNNMIAVANNKDQIDKNKLAIDENKKTIAENSKQIQENKTKIEDNTNKIAKNTENIAKNAEDIKANKENIAKNAKSIEDNKANIAKNAKAIDENKAKIEANKNQIDKNKQDIKNNKEKIDKNEQEIEKNRNNIDGNKKEIAVNKENIKTNTDSIEKNRGEIDKNKTSIANNMTKIAENNAKIVNNTSKINTNEAKIKNIEEEIANKGSVKSQTLTLSGNNERLFGSADLTIELKDDSIDEKHLNKNLKDKINNAATKEELKEVSNKVTKNTEKITENTESINKIEKELKTTNEKVDKNTEKIQKLDDIAVKYDSITKDKITLGGNGHSAVKITNLADGKENSDAVNYSQLKDIVNGDIKAGEKRGVSGDKIHKEFVKVREEAKEMSKQLSGGIATTMAMASIPQVGDNKLFSIGAGAVYYNKQGGFALGISGTEPSNTFVYKLSAGIDTQKTFGVSAGFNLNFIPNKKALTLNNNTTYGADKISKLEDKISKLEKENKEIKEIVKELKQNGGVGFKERLYVIDQFVNDKFMPTKAQIAKLKAIVKEINEKYPDRIIDITGHTDISAGEKYNLRLGLARANKVSELMISLGLTNQQNIRKVSSLGFNNQVNNGNFANRRVEIVVK